MKIKVVIVKPAGHGRPPFCPWVIEAAEGPLLQKPGK